ncbi:hypothetical protein MBLNU13_g00886t2 [Cladosporium sp. NU13]
MLSPLASLGVATLCFYTPATLASLLLCFKLRKAPVPATWFLLLLACLRINAAAFAILSAGGLPLILITILLLSIIRRTENLDDSASHYGIVALRLLFLTTLALTIAGVRMHAQPDNQTIVNIGQRLAEAGSVLSIFLLGVSLVGEVYAWVKYRFTLSLKSQKLLKGNLMVKPLLCLRLIYFCLGIFNLDSADKIWNPVTGSVAALCCMALIPEFATVLVYLWVGFTIDPNSTVGEAMISFAKDSGLKKCEEGK